MKTTTSWQNILTVYLKAWAKKGTHLLIYANWFVWSIISKELRFPVLDKTSTKQRAQVCCCLKLAPYHTTQLSFCLKLARIVNNLKLVQKTVRNCPVAQIWSQNILHNCLRFAPCVAQLFCCLKLAPNHTAQLSFCWKWATFVKKQQIVQNRARNCKFP